MIELYAVIGLACLDDEFREKLEESKDNTRSLGEVVRDYCFRLSRYELGEVQRLISIPAIVNAMGDIYENYWDWDDDCLPAMTPSSKYAHPTFFSKNGVEKVKFSRTPEERKEAAYALATANEAIRARKAAEQSASTENQAAKKSDKTE